MRLINCKTLEVEEFRSSDAPGYAILSHTWAEREASLDDWTKWPAPLRKVKLLSSPLFSKIVSTCKQARRDGISYVWVDTVCIDKSSSSELSEAINSMFAYYQRAKICYVYLRDVQSQPVDQIEPLDLMGRSRWFTRGWTLQELIAPKNVIFYARDWVPLGNKKALAVRISYWTGIDPMCLDKSKRLDEYSIAQRMAWAASRSTTREEDMAYCLLGIFNINMPLLYGEGSKKAFKRLQEEIIKVSDDHSILAFDTNRSEETVFAHHPRVFSGGTRVQSNLTPKITPPFSMTNAGLSITTPLIRTLSPFWVLAVLNCFEVHIGENTTRTQVCLPLFGKENRYMRARLPACLISRSVHEHPANLNDEMPDLTTRTESTYLISYFSRVYSAYGTEMDNALKGFEVDGPRTAGFMITLPRGLCNYNLLGSYPPTSLRSDISFFIPPLDSNDETKAAGILIFKDDTIYPSRSVALYLGLIYNSETARLQDWTCKVFEIDRHEYIEDGGEYIFTELQAAIRSEPHMNNRSIHPHFDRLGDTAAVAVTRFPTVTGQPCAEVIMVELCFDLETVYQEQEATPVRMSLG